MKRILTTLLTAALFGSPATPGSACGPWFPRQYLEDGGTSLLATPEFFLELELKTLAREFPTPFKAVHDAQPHRCNAERDLEDFDAAIKDGSVRPSDAEAARAAHRRMRGVLTQMENLNAKEWAALPADVLDEVRKQVFPSEFSDYHEGIIGYIRGDHAAACAAWQKLLARPESERRYRSVSATFMIGILAVADNKDDAPKWLAIARELAQRKFHDSAGLAAATYAWDERWYRERGDLRKAAESELRAVASGYASRYELVPANDTPEELGKFAGDPLLRRLYTSVLLGRYTGDWAMWTGHDEGAKKIGAWLVALESRRTREFAGAERVAWACYAQGNYAAAKRWLACARVESAESLWLAGKLAARDGRPADALRALSKAARLLAQQREPVLEVTRIAADSDSPGSALVADYGTVAIGAAEFRTALDAFLRGDHWEDAAYVAERLLTVEELRAYVVKREARIKPVQPATPKEEEASDGDFAFRGPPDEWAQNQQLRWLLARRLAREGRLGEARAYFPKAEQTALDRYMQGLETGNSPKLAKEMRALALWDAALEARYHGMELFGTEAAPDGFIHEGDYEVDDPAPYRLGESQPSRIDGKVHPLPVVLRATGAERERLRQSGPHPDQRFHYRFQAAEIAWQAAKLFPDNDQRLAEMLDLSGRWVDSRDPDRADRFYQAIEKRCAKTEIGQRATAQRWFVDIEHYTIANRPPAIPGIDDRP